MARVYTGSRLPLPDWGSFWVWFIPLPTDSGYPGSIVCIFPNNLGSPLKAWVASP